MSSNINTLEETYPFLCISTALTISALFCFFWGIWTSYKRFDSSVDFLYFPMNAALSNLFNLSSCICVSIYFIWLTFYPMDDTLFFLAHKSIRLRVATTVSWYISKIFIFLIFNGRLYYAFKGSIYGSNKMVFKTLNLFVIIHALCSLIVGYVGVMELRNEIIANIGFNSFHLNCAILLFYLLYQFNWRMMRLSAIDINDEFLFIVTRSTLLLTWIIPFMISVTVTWTAHRFIFKSSHYSMCCALIVMSLNSLIDIIAVLLLFKYSDKYYNFLCKYMHFCCLKCCHYVAVQNTTKNKDEIVAMELQQNNIPGIVTPSLEETQSLTVNTRHNLQIIPPLMYQSKSQPVPTQRPSAFICFADLNIPIETTFSDVDNVEGEINDISTKL